MSVNHPPRSGANLDLADILERHTTISYGEHVRARWAVQDVPALVAEVYRLHKLCDRLAMEGASETEERWRLEAERDHWRSVADEREGRIMYWQDRALGGDR